MGGLIFAAPASGSGKTTVTLGLLRAAARRGLPVRSAKSGPDYIDPRFHAAATGRECVNLDAWAMTPDRLRSLAAHEPGECLLIEGAMGLFDGAPPDGKGSSADLARILGLPVVLIIDCARMAGSVAAIVKGFTSLDPKVQVAGVILNNVGSPRHEDMLRRALPDTPILGAVPRNRALSQPSRHLGLEQAEERPDLETFLDTAAETMAAHLDMDALLHLAAQSAVPKGAALPLPPPAQRIAVARDRAFGFSYPHMLSDWRQAGAELLVFSPLNDDPVPQADFIFLPGGYPELHAGTLAQTQDFLPSLRKAAETTPVYGECGGYMVLGEGLIDAEGTRHAMAGLLRLETSFERRKLHLGYRHLTALHGPFPGDYTAHEFHYASTLRAEGEPLFTAHDATGTALGPMGLSHGHVQGSFAHIIDRAT
ncbi:cobyrinate a,c-diamide synthase [Roseovarius sp. A21]|uniref:Hydrogenobyrinate a,c-diamide synthase n=1 Tax=Roseovarius bejariae TaxID=2576383 RepID=A0A844CT87_9RHOB|nr:cobyrinate a,c-diamide synthase [Roseovarius bejariae]MRU14436.1 cobyrinate a,c-diamide synthase [Roseovarius bejariae]